MDPVIKYGWKMYLVGTCMGLFVGGITGFAVAVETLVR